MSEVDARLMVLSDTNATGYNHSGAAEVFSGFWPLPIHHMASVKKRKKNQNKTFYSKNIPDSAVTRLHLVMSERLLAPRFSSGKRDSLRCHLGHC